MKVLARTLALVFALAVPCAGISQEDTDVRRDRMQAAFGGWLAERELRGVVAIGRKGEIVAVSERGIAGDSAVETASLSKAITGICAAELVRDGQLDWTDTLRVGTRDFALSALITHSSGLGPDGTQIAMPTWLDAPGGHRSRDVVDLIETRGGQSGVEGAYLYNNENHALAALIIEDKTGRAYEDICREVALDPAGAEGTASARAGAFLPWGGWAMTVSDYARFHGYWFGRGHYASAPLDVPSVDVGQGISYGPGTFFKRFRTGNSFWHFGALCFPGRLNVGTYAVTWFADWTVTAVWDGCVSFPDMFALDGAFRAAAFDPLE